jgi:FtsP/CotA-like multicopper oxidase with cupredoxin domain
MRRPHVPDRRRGRRPRSFAPRGENQAFAGCGSPGAPLPQPGRDGYFARWPIGDRAVTLEVRTRVASARPVDARFAAADGERTLLNPTLVVERGQRVDLTLANAMPDPTIVHWHGLANDTRNDGALGPLVARGASFRYAYEVRDRAGCTGTTRTRTARPRARPTTGSSG